ncbi:MAG: sigma-54 dependent transcriptional regulator [Thermodesulfobacteriota bacterium]
METLTSSQKPPVKLLLAEDDEIMRITLVDRLRKVGWIVDEAENGRAALGLIRKNQYHLLISDIRMPELDGNGLLSEVMQISPDTDVIFMTAFGGVDNAVDCLRHGAADYLLKPFDMDDLIIRIQRLLAAQSLKAKCVSLEECCRRAQKPIIGNGPAMRAMLKMISQVAVTDATVLVTGESGTGKELVAAAIYLNSPRAKGPYVRVNCAAIPEGLIESELFGHEKGAFTGADVAKKGKFELANNGTILLDEIGELPLHLQAKMLRVLQEKEIERVGGSQSIKVDTRVICATARRLADEVNAGRFREDLYYRLKVIPVEVPPLRERKEDIAELCSFFFKEFSGVNQEPLRMSEESLQILMAYEFPGNVRELRNIIERISVLANGPDVQPWNLPADLTGGSRQLDGQQPLETLAEAVRMAEKNCITRALSRTDGKKAEAAVLLGISRKNLWEKMKNYGM